MVIIDKYWCLHSFNQYRYFFINNLFKEQKLNVEFYYNDCPPYLDLINIPDNVRTPYYEKFYKKNKNIYKNIISCFIGHYNIINISYKRGYKNIIVFEDDLTLLKNVQLRNVINSIPLDADYVNFYAPCYHNNFLLIENNNNEFTFNKITKELLKKKCICGNVMYFMNRKAMKYYLDYANEQKIFIADLYNQYFIDNNINCYLLKNQIIKPYNHKSLITNIMQNN